MTPHRLLLLATTLFLVPTLVFAAVDDKYNKTKKAADKTAIKDNRVVSSTLGLNIPDWGIAIDAAFDPSLTDIIPGYHIVNVVLTNRRGEPIVLDAAADKWTVVDSLGKRHVAYNHILQFDKKIWTQLPDRLKEILDYPHALNPGKSVNIDVFLPKGTNLLNFKEVTWRSQHFGKEFNMLTNYENSLSLSGDRQFDTPSNAAHVIIDENGNDNLNLPDSVNAPITVQERNIAPEDNTPQIGEVIDPSSSKPTFDPSLDDEVIVVR